MSERDINESAESNLKRITVKEFAAKFPTKRSVWELLSQ